MHAKSRPGHESKKPGKTMKQKRALKHAAHQPPPTSTSIVPPRKPPATR
ncbi:MAG: hypothetical protein WD794_08355 [Mycobacteriales bacterium]